MLLFLKFPFISRNCAKLFAVVDPGPTIFEVVLVMYGPGKYPNGSQKYDSKAGVNIWAYKMDFVVFYQFIIYNVACIQ